jgi:hypothetical protein
MICVKNLLSNISCLGPFKRPKFKTTKKTIFKKPILKKLILDMLFCGIFVAEASGLHPPPLLGWGGGGELIILRRVAPGVV